MNFNPSLPNLFPYNKENKDDFFNECVRNLEKFMDYLLSDQKIKNIQILYDFLCKEGNKEFEKIKKEFENTTPNNDIQNYKSVNGKIEININIDKEKKFEVIKNYCYENENCLDN